MIKGREGQPNKESRNKYIRRLRKRKTRKSKRTEDLEIGRQEGGNRSTSPGLRYKCNQGWLKKNMIPIKISVQEESLTQEKRGVVLDTRNRNLQIKGLTGKTGTPGQISNNRPIRGKNPTAKESEA
ncbi:hypothetical protein C922_05338 [Plasmodium inui San Antonio 1]|uniref:Uncharacterized protein n=1 Tax=Plasmodium inui San Antonio 1 TaxID=1237626 RepID=W6ZTN8_9APIC|nr:hypothetical protein C922_05338 [Plasmodium inui San Antonio 1]EUD64272.1 hypothetical protein C922_05338 [Plasmodium inui San Antonio 1]